MRALDEGARSASRAVASLETDFDHGIKSLLKVAHVRVFGAVDTLHVDHFHLWSDGEQGLVPRFQTDVDPDATIAQERFDLFEVFGLFELRPWRGDNDEAGFTFEGDQGLRAVFVVIHPVDLVAAIAHVDDAHAKRFLVLELQADLILANDLAKWTECFTRKRFGFDLNNLHNPLLPNALHTGAC